MTPALKSRAKQRQAQHKQGSLRAMKSKFQHSSAQQKLSQPLCSAHNVFLSTARLTDPQRESRLGRFPVGISPGLLWVSSRGRTTSLLASCRQYEGAPGRTSGGAAQPGTLQLQIKSILLRAAPQSTKHKHGFSLPCVQPTASLGRAHYHSVHLVGQAGGTHGGGTVW